MRKKLIFPILLLFLASCATALSASTDCERWMSEHKAELAQSRAVKKALAARHRLHAYAHRKLVQYRRPRPRAVHPLLRPAVGRPNRTPRQMLRRYDLLCGALPGEMAADPIMVGEALPEVPRGVTGPGEMALSGAPSGGVGSGRSATPELSGGLPYGSDSPMFGPIGGGGFGPGAGGPGSFGGPVAGSGGPVAGSGGPVAGSGGPGVPYVPSMPGAPGAGGPVDGTPGGALGGLPGLPTGGTPGGPGMPGGPELPGVPEPASVALVLTGAAGVVEMVRRRQA